MNGLLYMDRAKMIAKDEFVVQVKDKRIEKLQSAMYLERETMELLLTQKILAEKRAAEKKLEAERSSCWPEANRRAASSGGLSSCIRYALQRLIDCFPHKYRLVARDLDV